ncbi:mitochondrial import inner membrane translocase subunit Tim17/Tim22/Tim23 family protein [Actinidia rufa]|uniref:Mitochondrial import inner membrane translocase subunit Tim17/Tim22/Tim23 family protein n=1 Tax=Actinidia rufa TaxID=165716 RepID=A0A7J0GRN8_9ERIC|nr:mitochondrial import inner membrane translocase subunit Tim17/Tim22/Tim23 family protein [Actinidia rufa]
MATDDKTLEEVTSPSSSSKGWKERILIPTILAGIAGGGFGLVSKHRKAHGLANISGTYATNFAIVAGCYCGAREFVRATRESTPDDLMNSALAGFGSGAILGRLQGGHKGQVRYSIIFTVVGTAVDFATLQLKPALESYRESMIGSNDSSQKHGGWLRLPEWSPIQVLDEEALAAKKAREQKLYAQRNEHSLSKEKS